MSRFAWHRFQKGLVVELERPSRRRATRVGHDDVEATEVLDSRRDELLGGRGIGHVRLDGDHIGAT